MRHIDAFSAAVFFRLITAFMITTILMSTLGCTQVSATVETPTLLHQTPPPLDQTSTAIPSTAIPNTAIPNTATPNTATQNTWEEIVSQITWIAYSPTQANPNAGIETTSQEINQDLGLLRRAGFTGLVTYTTSGILGQELPTIAQEQGFQGIIVGIWDPTSRDEIAAAKAAAENPIVLGFCVGNEGLHIRYEMPDLIAAIEELKTTTGKPATTTEEIDDYVDETLLQTGDWVFPNAHPYFHSQIEPDMAVRWTKAAYDDLHRRAARFVIFKEVGLPTQGDPGENLSEENQKLYYMELADTGVKFVYFEAFDLPWKTHLPIEPHWGLFRSDRTPKLLAAYLMGEQPFSTPTPGESTFFIYQDIDFPANHFMPSGYMGDIGDITVDEGYTENPHSGKTSIRITYTAEGKGPSACGYPPPCNWAGVYWQEPPNNWGTDEFWKDAGFDLSGYTRLVFWARAETNGSVEYKVGGIIGPYGDSLEYPRMILAQLNQEWQEFEIDLRDANLTHIIGGFVWSANQQANPKGIIFYLDDIRFERE